MYNRTNPAVIKSILSRLSQKELLQEIEIIESKIDELEFGNRQIMFLNLHVYALQMVKPSNQCSFEF